MRPPTLVVSSMILLAQGFGALTAILLGIRQGTPCIDLGIVALPVGALLWWRSRTAWQFAVFGSMLNAVGCGVAWYLALVVADDKTGAVTIAGVHVPPWTPLVTGHLVTISLLVPVQLWLLLAKETRDAVRTNTA